MRVLLLYDLPKPDDSVEVAEREQDEGGTCGICWLHKHAAKKVFNRYVEWYNGGEVLCVIPVLWGCYI